MTIESILNSARTIAVVGMSDNPLRASFGVVVYLREQGYIVIPVNPRRTQIQGHICYPDLLSIPQKVDIVDIFRKSVDVPPVVDEAIKIGAKCVWMQLGVVNKQAAALANNAGLDVVMDKCIMAQHQLLKNGGLES